MAEDELPPRRILKSVPAHRNKTPPAVRRAVLGWWKSHEQDKWRDQVTLAEAMNDLGVVSVGVLLQALTSAETPADLRLKIALTMAPKLAVEIRGAALPMPGGDGGSVLDAYE
jgi:hypothetical protein